MKLNEIEHIMYGYNSAEIEKRLNDIFNGYLGCDTGDTPEELQQNHHLIRCIVNVFNKLNEVRNGNSIE
ncbi:MAG: hypothetical protein PHH37_04210 [Paludibacter sp.]|nr:hypothetical protein [Paludibacter sp.]